MRSDHHDRVNGSGNPTQILEPYFWPYRVTKVVTDVIGGHLSMRREDFPSGQPNLPIGQLKEG
jgi:hypothetical protein